MIPALVFDIETIPDVAGLRVAWDLAELPSDEAVAQAAFERRRLKVGNDFLPHHLHRVVAISCVFRDADGVRVRSLGTPQDDEPKLIQDFFRTVDRYKPRIVSWNGGGFDLPVLNYRAMIHGVPSARYWDTGDHDREFKYNNYLNRYHSRHLDLMDMLAMFTGRANAPLDEIARLCGFPGKLGMDGSKVWEAWRDGRIASIRDYCETDVANTWLLYCRFMLINGQLSPDEYQGEVALFRETLGKLQGGHWAEYLTAWPQQPIHLEP
jgi:hypothetical protein